MEQNPLDGIDPEIAFTFHILASATALTRDEFIAQQTAQALALRSAILSDSNATQALVVLAADPTQWTTAYLGARSRYHPRR
jgi:hypothetical protein